MRQLFIIALATVAIVGCDDGRTLTPYGEQLMKERQSQPTKFVEFQCPKENVVGRWYEVPKDSKAKTSNCIWNFNADGTIHIEGKCSRKIPDHYEIKREYTDVLNAFLDIELKFGKSVRINADCVTDGKTMKLDEGGWTFHKVL